MIVRCAFTFRKLAHVFRYVKKTVDLYSVYGGKEYTLKDLKLAAYADAAFADCPMLWKSKRQTVMTTSSTEAEFINLTPAGISLKWIAGMLAEFGAPQPAPALLLTDSANALAAVLNPLNSARTRSIDILYKWIINQVAAKRIRVQHLPSDEMVADGLTKPLGREKHARFLKLLGLVAILHHNTQNQA